jgi:hypothetical protein
MIKQNKAFLLLEVLLTVVLVSSSVVFINHAFSSSLRAMSLANSYQEAVMFMDEKIFDIELSMYFSDITSLSTEEIFSGTLFIWEQEVMPLEKQDLEGGYGSEDLSIERLLCRTTWDKNGRIDIKLLTYIPIVERQ